MTTRLTPSTAHKLVRPDRWHLALLWLRLAKPPQQLKLKLSPVEDRR